MIKDKRLFGKINIIDALIILIIIVALISAGVRLVSIKKADEAKKASISDASFQYVVSVKGVRENTLNGIKNSVGEKVMDLDNQKDFGIIENVEYEDATVYVTDKAGAVKKTALENKYDVLITVTVNNGKHDVKGYYTQSKKQILVGDMLYLSAGNIQTSGEITDLKIK